MLSYEKDLNNDILYFVIFILKYIYVNNNRTFLFVAVENFVLWLNYNMPLALIKNT